VRTVGDIRLSFVVGLESERCRKHRWLRF